MTTARRRKLLQSQADNLARQLPHDIDDAIIVLDLLAESLERAASVSPAIDGPLTLQ